MKKLFSIITAIALSTSVCYAEQYAPVTKVSLDKEQKTLIIEGYNTSDRYTNISLEILRDDAVWGLSGEGENRISEFNPKTDNILKYLLWFDQINDVKYNEIYKFTVPFYTYDELPEFRIRFGEEKTVYFDQKSVVKINNAETTEDIEQAVKDDAYIWGSVSEYYNEMLINGDLKDKFWQRFLSEKNNLKITGNAFVTTLEITYCIPEIIDIVLINSASSAKNLEEITENLIKNNKIENNSAQLFLNTGCFSDNKYFSAKQKEGLMDELFEKCTTYSDIAEYINGFSDKVLLYSLWNNSSKYFVDEILTKTDRLTASQKNYYTLLSGNKKLELCNLINSKKSPYESIEALCKEIYNASKNAEIDNDNSHLFTGGNGGGGIGSVSVPSLNNYNFTQTQNTEKTIFSDMIEASWATEAVNALANRNIVSGIDKNKFEPNRNITREEFVKILVSALQLPKGGECSFDDVSKDAWYYTFVSAAVNYGIATGEGNTFGIGKEISRQDMATMVYRAIEKRGGVLQTFENDTDFSDDVEIASYAKKACAFVKKCGIMTGMGENMFMPNEKATRAQAAKVIYELMKKEGAI